MEKFFEIISNEDCILASSAKSKRSLEHHFNTQRMHLGTDVWESYAVWSIDEFEIMLYEQLCYSNLNVGMPSLIRKEFEESLWIEAVIQYHHGQEAVSDFMLELADSGFNIFENMNYWGIHVDELGDFFSEEHLAIKNIIDIYLARLREKNILTRSELPSFLLKQLNSTLNFEFPYKSIYLYGFLDMSSEPKKLIEFLVEKYEIGLHCIDSVVANEIKSTQSYHRHIFESMDSELDFVLRWSKEIFESSKDHRIAIVVPNYYQRQKELRSKLSLLVQVDYFYQNNPKIYSIKEFNFDESSLKFFLEKILDWVTEGIYQYEILEILKIFFHHRIDSKDFSSFILKFNTKPSGRKMNWFESIEVFQKEDGELFAEEFILHFNALISLMNSDAFENFADWAKAYWEILSFLEKEFHCLSHMGDNFFELLEQAFQNLFQIRMDILSKKNMLIVFIQKFFQEILPKEKASIEIISPMEAIGSIYTHLWLLDASFEKIENTLKPIPFIDVALQKKYEVRAHSSENRYALAEKIVQMIYASSDEVHISLSSTAMEEGGYFPQACSELFLEAQDNEALFYYLQDVKKTEVEGDKNQIPIIQKNWNLKISDIQNYYDCPFKFYFSYNYNHYTQPDIFYFPTPSEMGSFIHKYLELYYLKNAHLTEREFNDLLDNSLMNLDKDFFDDFKAYLKEIINELDASNLLKGGIISLEQKGSYSFENIRINYRIDRIDQYNQGCILVDYKTGTVKPFFSDSENQFEDIQLLVYTYLLEKSQKFHFKVQGVTLYYVVDAKFIFKVDDHDFCFEAFKSAHLPLVENVLKSISKEPLNRMPRSSKVCDTCRVRPICRIDSEFYETHY